MAEYSIDTNGKEVIVRGPQTIQCSQQATKISTFLEQHLDIRTEPCDCGKRRLDLIGDFIDRAIRAHLEDLAVNDHHFAIQMFKGAQSKIAVLFERPAVYCSIRDPFDESR